MMMSWQTLLAIGSGGFIGAVSRAYLNGLISSKVPHELPFGTLGVNLIGSFIMGLLVSYFMYSTLFSVHAKSFTPHLHAVPLLMLAALQQAGSD